MTQSEYVKAVAESLIRQLEMGTAPWQRPWKSGESFMPRNANTGNLYQGMNAVWLMSQAEKKGYEDTRWITYKQAQDLGAQVNKGERGTPIQYWQWSREIKKTDENNNPLIDSDGQPLKETIKLQNPMIRSAVVFNANQINGLSEERFNILPEWERHQQAETILRDSEAVIHHTPGDRAFYRLSTDSITLPLREQFSTADNYYSTALHELGHWTGHESRLNRDLANPFGSEAYAKEELRAEIASMMLGEKLSIGHDPSQHAAYVGSWIKALREDPREIFRAASDSEKIIQYLTEPRQRTKTIQNNIPMQVVVPEVAVLNEVQEEVTVAVLAERVYLTVPYEEKDKAKTLGAKWDKAEKSWYIPTQHPNPERFEQWKNVKPVETHDRLSPEIEFAEALRLAGLIVDGTPIMDGRRHRLPVIGDDYGKTSGSYIGFSDGHPAGSIENFREGLKQTWKYSQKAEKISPIDLARLEAEAEEKRDARDKKRQAIAIQTAEAVATHWAAAKEADDHPYLKAKGVRSYGLRTNTLGALPLMSEENAIPQRWSNAGELLIPVLDAEGNFWGAQSIDDSGQKRFPRGGKLQGCHFVIGDVDSNKEILISEGYATGATLHELTGKTVVVAFHSGNLSAVAESYREKYPEKVLILAGDNDHKKADDKNVGRIKAEDAARKVNGYTLFPTFEKMSSGTDWNDLVKEKGKEAMQRSLNHQLAVIQKKIALQAELNRERQLSRPLELSPLNSRNLSR